MKSIVLSLERDKKRRDLFFSQPQAANFEVFYAIDAQKPEDRLRIESVFNQKVAREYYGRELTLGEMACTLSHLEIMRRFTIQSDDNYVVICEDDALFSKDFDLLLPQILDQSCYDIVVFGESKVSSFERTYTEKIKTPLQFFPKKYGKYRVGMFDGQIWGTVGYAVSRRFAEILLQQKDIFWLADDYLYFSKLSAKVAYVCPRLVIENLKIVSNLELERKKKQENIEEKNLTIWERIRSRYFYIKRVAIILISYFKRKYEAYRRSL